MYAERQHSILVDRLLKFGKWLAMPPAESPTELQSASLADYAGLGAARPGSAGPGSAGQRLDARRFTDQLCNLQKSLRLACDTQAEPVKVISQVQ
ncbi:MAG TPA: hypothetical protein VHY84_16770 [Bryobacteraceae bacterium]|jgi:hypothetical protein|nr:hypothetical protein [Bryobacteraceae bacterium]